MSKATHAIIAALSPGERDYIRRELDQFFSTLPSVADGFQLRTWRGGPHAGQPKVPAAAQGLLDRGLVRLQPTPWPPRLFFTDAGLAALRAMMADGRLASPKTFAHVRRELGIDPDPASNQDLATGPSEASQAAQGSRAAAFPSPAEWDNDSVPAARNPPMARTPKADTPPIPARRGRKPGQQADGPEPAGEGDTSIAGMVVPVSGEPTSNASPKEHERAAPQAGDAVPTCPHSDTSAPATPAARWDEASDTVSFDWPAIERTAAQHGPNQAMAKLLIAARTEGTHSRWPL